MKHTDDYYEILGIERHATRDDVKKAFHRLARKYHPDVNQNNPQALEFFKKITLSYETLSDPQRRRQYDMHNFVHQVTKNTDPIQDTVDFAVGKFSDFVNDLLFKTKSRANRARAPQAGNTKHINLSISFAESYIGATKNIEVEVPRTCSICTGRGWPKAYPPATCPECDGAGEKVAKGPIPFRRSCKRCDGLGKILTKTCPACKGTTLVDILEKISVKIPAGIRPSQTVVVPKKGAAGKNRGIHGDLIVHIHVEPDTYFSRDNDTLFIQAQAKISDVLLGKPIEVKLPRGSVSMKIPLGTQNGQHVRLKGKGFINIASGQPADALVQINFHIPTQVSSSSLALVEELASQIGDF